MTIVNADAGARAARRFPARRRKTHIKGRMRPCRQLQAADQRIYENASSQIMKLVLFLLDRIFVDRRLVPVLPEEEETNIGRIKKS